MRSREISYKALLTPEEKNFVGYFIHQRHYVELKSLLQVLLGREDLKVEEVVAAASSGFLESKWLNASEAEIQELAELVVRQIISRHGITVAKKSVRRELMDTVTDFTNKFKVDGGLTHFQKILSLCGLNMTEILEAEDTFRNLLES